MNKSQSIAKLAAALVNVQAEVRGAIKDASNPFFKSKYADLESCWDALREPLTSNGLAVVQTMGFIVGGGPTVVTTLVHESGEWIAGEQPVCAKSDTNPQDLGSAITYARRYGLSAITGLIQVDDDAESVAASKRGGGVPAGKPNLQAVPADPGAFVVTIGKKWAGQRLDKIGPHDVAQFYDWLVGEHAKKNEKPAGDVATNMEAMDAFIKSRSFERAK